MLQNWFRNLGKMGPAWIISAVACGPATLASVSIAGAAFGYRLLWVVVLSAVFGATAQYLAARAGIIEGRGIIAATQDRLGNTWAWVLTIDAVLATYLAAMILMNALAGVTSVITGVDSPWWGVGYAVLISLLMMQGGYRWLEMVCKTMVGLVVTCFLITAFLADIDAGQVVSGLIPNFPGGLDSALMCAAIMGGAVHITIIGMHTYNTGAKGWTLEHLGLARQDTVLSMGVAFGLYSLAVFLVAAAVLHPNQIKVRLATDAALALGPLLGRGAMAIFLTGLWAATLSTILPTFLAAIYFIFDKMQWKVERTDPKFKILVIAGAAIASLGPFLKGGFFLLLPMMLALGLCGTPLILGIILYLLNKKEYVGERGNSLVLNILGAAAMIVTTILALRFLLAKSGLM